VGSRASGNDLGGATLRHAIVAAWCGVGLGLVGCSATTQYRNYQLPAALAPSAPPDAAPGDPISLSYTDSSQMDGGLRMVLPDRAVPAPAFSVRALDDLVYTNSSLQGRVVWIDLWAVWCATCRAEFPAIQRIHERYAGDGLTVLAVCRNSSPAAFEAAARKPWLTFPIADASGIEDFSIPYGAFPTSLVLDRAGRVRAYWQGHRPLDAVDTLLQKLLAEPVPARLPAPGARSIAGLLGPGPPRSDTVMTSELLLPRREVVPGEVFEGRLVLDLDPGWHINVDSRYDSIPLELALEGGEGLVTIDWLRPLAAELTVGGASRAVYTGRVELPLWGMVGADAPGRPIPVRLAATIQACDSTKCLLPAEIVLSGEVPVAEGRAGSR